MTTQWLYHWQAQGLEMFVCAGCSGDAHKAILAKLEACKWQEPARYEMAIADVKADCEPFTQAYIGQVVMLDCQANGKWKAMWTT